MGYIEKIKAGIAQGRQDMIHAQEEQEKKRQAEMELAVKETRENPSRIARVGITLGKTAQRLEPVRATVANTAPKIKKGVSSITKSVVSGGVRPAPIVRQQKGQKREIRYSQRSPGAGWAIPGGANPLVDDMFAPPRVEPIRPRSTKGKKKGKGKQGKGKRSNTGRRPHTFDDDLLFGGGGFLL